MWLVWCDGHQEARGILIRSLDKISGRRVKSATKKLHSLHRTSLVQSSFITIAQNLFDVGAANPKGSVLKKTIRSCCISNNYARIIGQHWSNHLRILLISKDLIGFFNTEPFGFAAPKLKRSCSIVIKDAWTRLVR